MMCEECEEFPAQYIAYFNKAGGKLWRPAQKVATPWAIDIRPDGAQQDAVFVAPHAFVCDDPTAPTPAVPADPRKADDETDEGVA